MVNQSCCTNLIEANVVGKTACPDSVQQSKCTESINIALSSEIEEDAIVSLVHLLSIFK